MAMLKTTSYCVLACVNNQSCGQFLNGVQVTTRARQLAASGSTCSSCMCCRCVIYLARENYTLHIFITRQTRVEKSTLRRCHDPFSRHPLLFFCTRYVPRRPAPPHSSDRRSRRAQLAESPSPRVTPLPERDSITCAGSRLQARAPGGGRCHNTRSDLLTSLSQ